MVIRVAVEALHYIARFCVVYIIASHTWHTCSLATRQLPALRTPFLLEEKHGMVYYFWIAVGYRLRLHERLYRLCIIVLLYYFLWTSARPVGILFSLANEKLQTLRTPFLLEQKHGMFSKTTNATDSVPLGAKARYVLLFLDSGML